MELVPTDAKKLRDMVTEEWFPHKERELEATFGVGGVVDSTRFLAVAQRLKSKGFKEVRQPDRLTISLEDNTRYTIQGEGTIAQYCQDNSIVNKSVEVMIKDRAGDLHTLDISEYDTRIKIRRELPLDLQDPRVKSHFATWDQRVKFFRLIQRYTFTGNGVIFDLSMVRSTKKDDRGLWKQVKKFYDEDLHHNIMREMPSYEIEVELDRSSEYTDTAEKAIKCLIQGIGEVLRGIQRNPILIRNSVRQEVIEGYNRLVKAKDESGFRGFRGVQPVTLEKDNMSTQGLVQYKTVSIRKGFNVTDKADGLRVLAYTDPKGELFMLDMGLNVYRTGLKKPACANCLLDGEWITKNKENEPVQMLMLFDMYVENDDVERTSTPVYKREFIHSESTTSTRHKAILDWCAKWRAGGGPELLVKGLTPQNSLKVMEKKFLMAAGSETAPSTDIFTKCAQMLSRDVPYNTDGLIITNNRAPLPPRFGVRFPTQFKWKPSHDNTIDFLVKIVKDPQTNLDKLTDIIRPDSQDTIKYKTLRLYVGTSADPGYDDPRRTILMIKKLPSGRYGGKGQKRFRMRPILFNPLNFEDSSASICYLKADEDPATRDWIIRCSTKDDAPGEATGDPITNNSIVEMRYDANPSIPSGWNWIPIRVRYDKTERFQSGTIDKTLNSIETANSVWNSIHDPITHHMITTGDDKPSAEENQAQIVAQQQKATEVKRYYQKKSTIKNISLIKNMAMFHNLIVKGSILTDKLLSTSVSIGLPERKTVLDTSIGKGGDLGRYYHKVEYLVGIDLDADGIRDPDEGAYRRYMDELITSYQYATPNIPTMVFLIGDSTKSYVDGSSGINEEEADMMRAVFGKVPPVAKVPPYIDAKCKGILANGAHAIYSMFSIHYYFKDKATWEGFLYNIRDNLKVGGFFACCCFDGNILTNRLKDIEKGNAIEGVDSVSGASIWRITKENDLGEILPSSAEEGFGHAIDVEFLSIGAPHREYLVSPTLLQDQLRLIGVEPCSPQDCATLGLPSYSMSFAQTYNSQAMYRTSYPMQAEVSEFSFFNRWYVFRRYGTAPVNGARTPDMGPIQSQTPPFGAMLQQQQQGESPPYSALSPAYGSTVVQQQGESPPYSALSPAYGFTVVQQQQSTSPTYSPNSPPYTAVSPAYGSTVVQQQGQSPPYTPLSPMYAPSGSAALENRPASSAWQNVPLSGSLAQTAALQGVGPRTPPFAPSDQEETDELPPGPIYPEDFDLINQREADDAYEAQKEEIKQRARERLAATLPTNLSEEAKESRLATAADEAVARAIERYKQRRGTGSGAVTAIVEGGARTVAVERSTAAGPQKKFKPHEVFRFFGKAELKDALGIQDAGAARWLALSAPFPIEDGKTEYPTVNHYLAAMKYKVATDKPELAVDLFSTKGTIHTKYLRQREAIAVQHKGEKEKGQVKEQEDQELLRAEAADVANAALPKTIKRYKAQFDEAKWIAQKDDFLKEALSQRWKHDARFRKIVEAARLKGKYLLYYTGSSTISSFGGIRRDDGTIEGENQVGKIIMELAGYPPL